VGQGIAKHNRAQTTEKATERATPHRQECLHRISGIGEVGVPLPRTLSAEEVSLHTSDSVGEDQIAGLGTFAIIRSEFVHQRSGNWQFASIGH
jgi:hypothetical protein